MPFEILRPEDGPPIDPLVAALTPSHVRKDIEEYERLLNSRAPEQDIQAFLSNHAYFFNTILRLYGVSPLYSKVRLGSEYEVDFAAFDTGSVGPEWYLIEIEAPSHNLFTKAGDPSAALTHAMRQVRDWQTWTRDHPDYAKKLLPHIEYPLGYVFIGRRAELGSEANRKRLRAMNNENRRVMEVHSLDYFLSTAHSTLDIVERAGHGDWALPMKALTHADLAAGLPPAATRYMELYFRTNSRDYPEDFLRARETKYHGRSPDEDFV